MGVKKSKPTSLPRHHEIKVDAVVERARKSVESSKNRISESKRLTKESEQLIDGHRQKRGRSK